MRFGLAIGRELYLAVTSRLAVLTIGLMLVVPAMRGQSGDGQTQNQPPAQAQQPSQDIPDAPSAVQPPAPKLPQPTERAPNPPPDRQSQSSSESQQQQQPPPPKMPPVETIPPGSMPETRNQGKGPRNQINPEEDIYKIVTTTNFVQLPVMVKDSRGRRVDGLLPKDFIVNENGKPQKLTFFSSEPVQLSVAIVLDTALQDVDLQKVNQTYSSLVGALSPYDEFALYTYSSTVSQVTDFTGKSRRLEAALDQIKEVRGRDNGPPVLGGPMASGPTVNGLPVGGPAVPPVNTPPRESYVLNDAIMRAALDLSHRDRTRRKLILVISDGRERGSAAGYKEVLRLLQTYGIEVKAIVVGGSALPVYKEVDKVHHVFLQGYSNILPKYTNATGGGEPYSEISRNAIEDAYASAASEARNMYTLGYAPQAVAGSSPYRRIEVIVTGHGRDLKIYAKDGYYPVPTAR